MDTSRDEYDFVEEPGKEFFCPVTFELLKDPRQTNTCCGNHLSRAVAERLEAEGKPCPLRQKAPLKTTEDLFFKRKVMALKVRCSTTRGGCGWRGELGNLEKHLSSGEKCSVVAVECPLKCGKRIQRRHLVKHQAKECSKRQFNCQHCGGYQSTHEKVVNDHWPKCQQYPQNCPNKCSTGSLERRFLKRHLKEECPLQEIECDFSNAGCKKKMPRQAMQKHLDESKDQHLKTMAVEFKRLSKVVNDLQCAIPQISPKPVFIPPPEMIMDNFEKRKNAGTIWCSPPFNTHVGGYKMYLCVDANGWGSGKGTHVSLSVYMMKGEFDSHLQWPFKGGVTVEIVNQKEGGKNCVQILLRNSGIFQRVTEGEKANKGQGLTQFIAHTDLYKPEEDKEYLLNDTLIFRITNVVVTI